jgi:serine/threonine-protein kinase
MPELCAMILQDAPTPLRALRPDVPPGLEAALMRCLEKPPGSRFADLAELAAALAPFGAAGAEQREARVSRALLARVSDPGASGPLPAQTGPVRPVLAPTLDARTAQTWTGVLPPTPRSRAPRIVAVAAVVATVGFGLGVLLLRHNASQPIAPVAVATTAASVEPRATEAPAAPSSTPDTNPQPPPTSGVEPTQAATGDAGVSTPRSGPSAVAIPGPPTPRPAIKLQPPRPHPPATNPRPPPSSSVDPNGRADKRYE